MWRFLKKWNDNQEYRVKPTKWLLQQWAESYDETAYLEIYDRYHQKIFEFIYDMTNDLQKSEDILQNTFLILFQKPENFKNVDNLLAYLKGVANNYIKEFYELKNVEINSNETDDEVVNIEDETQNLDSELINKDYREKLWQIIYALMPEKYRLIYTRYMHGYTAQQIAIDSSTKLRTVEDIINDCHKRVKKEFKVMIGKSYE